MPSPRRFPCLLAMILATIAAFPAAGVQRTDVRIFFDGGNAFVQSLTVPNQLTVGAIASQTPPGDYNSHSMHLMVDDGSVDADATLTTLPPVPLTTHGYWDLSGWSVEICPGGLCPTSNTLALAPLHSSNDDCADASDNIGLIPNLWTLHPSVTIGPDWRNKLDSEVVLRAGRLTGAAGGNCFEIRGPHGTLVRNVALGPKEIKWELLPSENPYAFVDLVFTPKYGAGTVRRARVHKGAYAIDLRIWTLVPASGYPDVAVGDEIRHFQQFYSLYTDQVVPINERYRMYLKKRLGGGVSPGTECPPAMLMAR